MNKTSHTPGPWQRNIKPAKKYPTVFSGRNKHVAYVATEGLSEEEIEANIDLITAAPAMLEALECHDDHCRLAKMESTPALVKKWGKRWAELFPGDSFRGNQDEMWVLFLALQVYAIAKAKGENCHLKHRV